MEHCIIEKNAASKATVQKEKDSTKAIAVENEHDAHSKNEADSGKIDANRLPSVLTEGIVGDPASRESHLKMGGPKKTHCSPYCCYSLPSNGCLHRSCLALVGC
jgi:hypothetical protein